tara:strand:- start:146 stop:373 length:228 start_codon:yes stop_codon:yes gene_type:complete
MLSGAFGGFRKTPFAFAVLWQKCGETGLYHNFATIGHTFAKDTPYFSKAFYAISKACESTLSQFFCIIVVVYQRL